MPHPAPPALDTNNRIPLIQDPKFNRVENAPLEPLVDVFLPGHVLEGFRFGLREEEGVDAAVEVGVARGARVAGHHYDGADGAVFGD